MSLLILLWRCVKLSVSRRAQKIIKLFYYYLSSRVSYRPLPPSLVGVVAVVLLLLVHLPLALCPLSRESQHGWSQGSRLSRVGNV